MDDSTTVVTNGDTHNKNHDDADFGPNIHISSHPVLSHKITILRSSETKAGTFRAAMRAITYHLAYEATSKLTTKPIAVSVAIPKLEDQHVECQGSKLVERVALIPILRSGLGMADSMLDLLPDASSYHIGMYKIKGQNPVLYFNRLPRKCQSDVAYVLDPVIATASTVISVVKILKKWGVPKIHVIAVIGSRTGLKQVVEAHPDISLTVGTVDDTVNDDGVVLPGLGDSGDRLFGTSELPDAEEDEALLHPSKRKKLV